MQNFEHCLAITQLALDNDCVFDGADDGLAAGPLFSIPESVDEYTFASALVKAINYLYSIGWDLEERNHHGQTPLLHAATECRPQVARCLKTLIERGAKLDARDETGRGSLHSALSPPRGLSDWVDPRCTSCSEEDHSGETNNDCLSSRWRTEDHRYAEDYYDRESTLDTIFSSASPDISRLKSSLDVVGNSQLVVNPESNASAKQPTPIDLSSPGSNSDASSYAESISEIDDDDAYVYGACEEGAENSWIRNPMHVLKDSVRTKLKILLEAGCDPNDLDYAEKSPNDYASNGLWPQWLWALERTGYVFDGEQDRWIKRIGSAE